MIPNTINTVDSANYCEFGLKLLRNGNERLIERNFGDINKKQNKNKMIEGYLM